MAEQQQGSFDVLEGVALPGPAQHEPYMIGSEYARPSNELGSHVPGLDSPLPSEDGTQNMGWLGQDGGAGKGADFDAMAGLNSDALPLFNDGSHPDQPGASGIDAMQGLADNRHIEILTGEQMHSSQAVPGFSPLGETANPLVGGEE
jgi:hypothetical protein